MRVDRLLRPYAVCSSVTAYTVHSSKKKPTARISTEYAPMLHPPGGCECMACMADRGNRDGGLSAGWRFPTRYGRMTGEKGGSHGFEARHRQQEIFVVVDAAVAGATSQQSSVRFS